MLYDLAIMSYPHAVPFKGVAKRILHASSRQARGRGRTRHHRATLAAGSGEADPVGVQ
jgi:hypothetical protein